jgi:hypothetical protein
MPDGSGFVVLSEALQDLREAHRIAFKWERARAEERRDATWFTHHGLLPPWWVLKKDPETGDLHVLVSSM